MVPRDEIFMIDIRDCLQRAAKSATMASERFDGMTAVRKHNETPADDDSVFDDADALIALAQKSFTRAAHAQVSENDRLGITTHGAVGGKLRTRQPRKARTLDQH